MQTAATPVIELTVPCSAEYVSVVRLAVLGLCGRIPLTYDEVEDLRLAVGEACASSVFRASQMDDLDGHIQMLASVESSQIVLEISDNIHLPPEVDPPDEDTDFETDFDDQHFRVSLMQLLVDEVSIAEAPGGGQAVRLVKKCEIPE